MASKYPQTATFRSVAELQLPCGNRFPVALSLGCERFVGRYARLPELRGGDGIIRFALRPDASLIY